MLNAIFIVIVVAAVLLAAAAGKMPELTLAIVTEAKEAVELAIRLVGVMALFLGLMRVLERGGLLRTLARALAPVMRRLFPEVPPDHPAMSAMILNFGANMMGLTNAATPFGIKAIEELDRLNGSKGTATNAMVLFLALNTSGLAILPSGVISLRASLGSQDPAGIFVTTWVASGCATIVALLAAMALARLPRYRATKPPLAPSAVAAHETAPAAEALPGMPEEAREPVSRWRALAVGAFWAVFVALLVNTVWGQASGGALDVLQSVASYWILPALVVGMVLFGWMRGVQVYAAVVEGAKEGFQVALRIIPYLVAILVAVGMLRASGGIDLIVRWLDPVTSLIGMPAEALPMALLRPLSGSGAYGVMAEIMKAHGPDTHIGYLVSTLQGSTETTFYVLAVYFGAVGVTRTRHALPACLLADAAGTLAAVLIVGLLYGS